MPSTTSSSNGVAQTGASQVQLVLPMELPKLVLAINKSFSS